MSDLSNQASRYQFGQTNWPGVLAAGQQQGKTGCAARNELLVRYHDAVYRYLVARLGDSDAAGELFSRFAERVMEIHPFLQRVDPDKGRFRNYLKAILSRMVIDYYRENQRERKHRRDLVHAEEQEAAAPEDSGAAEAEFQKVWSEELLNHAWRALEEVEKTKGKPYYSLLLHKAQHPQDRSEAMAEHFAPKLGRPLTAVNVRQLLHRGQELLNDLLVDEVARSLRTELGESITAERIEEELLQLKLLDKQRKAAIERYRART